MAGRAPVVLDACNGVVWAGNSHLNKPGPWKRRDLRKLGIAARRGRGR